MNQTADQSQSRNLWLAVAALILAAIAVGAVFLWQKPMVTELEERVTALETKKPPKDTVKVHQFDLTPGLEDSSGTLIKACIPDPPEITAARGTSIQFFSKDSDATIDFDVLNPANKKGWTDWTNTDKDKKLKKGVLSKKFKIKKNAAKGEYRIKVTCGGSKDDPPVVDVW